MTRCSEFEADLREQFERRKPALQAFGEFVKDYVVERLEEKIGSSEQVKMFLKVSVTPRVKETDSFITKALFRKKGYKNPLEEIEDQVGVRFVVLLLEDIKLVGNIVRNGPWKWEKARDFENEKQVNPSLFEYQSDHYVVSAKNHFNHNGANIPQGMPCEIQIRTLLQHAYAELSHECNYKPSLRLPGVEQRKLQRALAKGSALIETTDDIFKEIKDQVSEYDKNIKELQTVSSEIYTRLTGQPPSEPSLLGKYILDSYRDLIKDLSPKELSAWIEAKERAFLPEILKKKREKSFFYRDSIVILLAWLVSMHETSVSREWPVDLTYLEDFYSTMGISTNGIF